LDADQTIDQKLHCTSQRALEIMIHAETQLFLYNLLLAKLLDDGDIKNAKDFGDFVHAKIKNVGIRTLDHLIAKAMFLVALAYEKNGLLT
jgi:26S proteasome regulatory subunit N3